MAKKTKKEHYVPQCYLEAWSIPDTQQVHVFDKEKGMNRINNIQDVASERYFYDVEPQDILAEEVIDLYKIYGATKEDETRVQFVEKLLSTDIETRFSECLTEMIQKASKATPWIMKYCYFINEQQKLLFSMLLSVQYLRTKQKRSTIDQTSDCVAQVLKDMGASDDVLAKYTIPEGESKELQVLMMLNPEIVVDFVQSFFSLTWILCINKTSKKLYTSDNPISIYGPNNNPYESGIGLRTRGVVVVFPISPTCILVMFDGGYYMNQQIKDRCYNEMYREEDVDFYNRLCVEQSERCFYSSDGDMTLIQRMKEEGHDITRHSSIKVMCGGKTYYPTDFPRKN